MNLLNAVLVGLKEIWAHRFRSMLTLLGIVLGVSSLVAMSALVKGMENGMKEALVAIGGVERIRIEPEDLPVEQRHLEDQAVGCTMHDVYALQRSAPLIKLVTPEMRGLGYLPVSRGDKQADWAYVVGTWPSALEMNEHVIEHGRMFNELDLESAWNVCVIGTGIRDQLFGAPEEVGHEIIPLGEYINIKDQPFRIIGMFTRYESEQERKERELAKNQPKTEETGPARRRGWGGRGGSFVFGWKNQTIYMPLSTMWTKFRQGGSGTNTFADPRLSALYIKVADIELMEPALQQARNVLMHTHKGIEDFEFETQESWAEQITTSIRNARLSGGMIAIISLLVGGIGIMNIMLASINERVREIGVRKAIGATFGNIFVQILVESVVIALLGGVAGLLASYGLVQLLVFLSPTENSPVITPAAMIIAFTFSALVGILAGLIPALKAARLNPIDALRYE